MFCGKCGKQLPDNAAFCDACGQPTGAASQNQGAPAPVQAPNPVPPILENLLKTLKGFFATTNQTGAVAESAKDKSWSGIIVLIVTILIDGLAKLVSSVQKGLKGGLGEIFGKELLSFAVQAVIAILAMYVITTVICRIPASFGGVVNVVSYSLITVLVADLLGMALGFAWTDFVDILSGAAVISGLYLAVSALGKLTSGKKCLFLSMVVLAVLWQLTGAIMNLIL